MVRLILNQIFSRHFSRPIFSSSNFGFQGAEAKKELNALNSLRLDLGENPIFEEAARNLEGHAKTLTDLFSRPACRSLPHSSL